MLPSAADTLPTFKAAEDGLFSESLAAGAQLLPPKDVPVQLWAARRERAKLFSDLRAIDHPATKAAAAGQAQWWLHRAPSSATLFLALFGWRQYRLARDLVEALVEDGYAEAAQSLMTSTFERAPSSSAPAYSPGKTHVDDEEVTIGSLYEGQNALHIFIAQRKRSAARWEPLSQISWLLRLPDKSLFPELLRGRATGSFFQPSRYTDFRKDDTASWGEFPLSFAASLMDREMVTFLCECQADLLAQDSRGNTALHCALLNGYPSVPMCLEMVFLLREQWFLHSHRYTGCKHLNLDQVVNLDGLTPLMLASSLDTEVGAAFFKGLLEHDDYGRGAVSEYGHVQTFFYPLEGLDDVFDIANAAAVKKGEGSERGKWLANDLPKHTALRLGASLPKLWPRHTLLELVARLDLKESRGVFALEFVERLLESKWLMYGCAVVLYDLFTSLALLSLLTWVVILRSLVAGGQEAEAWPPLAASALSPPFSFLLGLGFGRSALCLPAAIHWPLTRCAFCSPGAGTLCVRTLPSCPTLCSAMVARSLAAGCGSSFVGSFSCCARWWRPGRRSPGSFSLRCRSCACCRGSRWCASPWAGRITASLWCAQAHPAKGPPALFGFLLHCHCRLYARVFHLEARHGRAWLQRGAL